MPFINPTSFEDGLPLAIGGASAGAFSFRIFLDLFGEGLSGGANVRRYTARLLADGVELPVRSVEERAPRGALGVSLDVELAKPDRSLVSSSSDLKFEIGVWAGGGYQWQTVMEGGRLAGLLARYANADNRPADAVTFSTLDFMGDRWTLRPAAPVILYDPLEVDEPGKPDPQTLVRDYVTGATIEPLRVPVAGLTLYELLKRAYVEGCGFSAVVTNVPDFPVLLAEFTLGGGYHAGASRFLELPEPLYHANGEELWITDPDAPLPEGLSHDVLTEAQVRDISDQQPPRRPVEAIIVEYKAERGDYFTEQDLDPEVVEAPPGGFTQMEQRRRVRRWRKTGAPDVVVREEDVRVETRTLNHEFVELGRETETFSFDALGRQSGHTLTVRARLPDLEAGGALDLLTVSEETYSITYRESGRHGADEIARTVKSLAGLVLIDGDKEYLGNPYEMPYLDAHHSGYIDPDADQSAEFRAVRTEIETYVREGDAVRVRRQVANHLNGGTIESPSSATRAGSTSVNRRSQGTTKALITAAGVSASALRRTVPTINAGDLPADLAIMYGRRYLARLNNPPRQVSITIPYIDWRVRRGKVFEVRARGGASLGLFIVEGYQRRIANLDTGAPDYSMTLTARGVTQTDEAATAPTVFSLSLTSEAESPVFTVPVPALAGQFLTAGGDASASVLARVQGSGADFVDISAEPIDLTPYDGDEVTFDVKVLAAEVTGVKRMALEVRATDAP